MTNAPVLVNPDFSKELILACDDNKSGVGGVLEQLNEEGKERPIYFFSYKLNDALKIT